jgi:hypothetical protein
VLSRLGRAWLPVLENPPVRNRQGPTTEVPTGVGTLRGSLQIRNEHITESVTPVSIGDWSLSYSGMCLSPGSLRMTMGLSRARWSHGAGLIYCSSS